MEQPVTFLVVETPEQIARTAQLAREIWEEFYLPIIGRAQVDYMVDKFQSADAIAAQLAEGVVYVLVQRGAEPVGYFAVQPRGEDELFISKFYLHQSARGAGLGRASMDWIERFAHDRRRRLLWLTVNKRNPSLRVYERLGFRKTAELVADIGAGFVMDDFRMEKRLD